MNIRSFANLVDVMKSQGCSADTMIKLDGDQLKSGDRLGGLGARLFRNIFGGTPSVGVREQLLQAVKSEFKDGVIPKSVLDAMGVGRTASGFYVETVNGEQQVKVSARPLTMRRVQAIVDAVTAEKVVKLAEAEIDVLKEQVKEQVLKRMMPTIAGNSSLANLYRSSVEKFAQCFKTTLLPKFVKTPMKDFVRIRDEIQREFDLHITSVDSLIPKESMNPERKAFLEASHAMLNELACKMARERFANVPRQELFGAKNTIPGDAGIAKDVEDHVNDVFAEGVAERGGIDGYIEYKIGKIIDDGCRGQTVKINGQELPTLDESGKDIERSRERCMEKIRTMLENLCRDPKTGRVDRKSMAMMLDAMTQNMMYFVPVVCAIDNPKTGNPIGLVAAGRTKIDRMSTEITMSGVGEWKLKIDFLSRCDQYRVQNDDEVTYYTELCDGNEGETNQYGFETELTFRSAFIGKDEHELSPNDQERDPTVKCSAEKTTIVFNTAKLETMEHARISYRNLLRRISSGDCGSNQLDICLRHFNQLIRSKASHEGLSSEQFQSWVRSHEEAILSKLMAWSEEMRNDDDFGVPTLGYLAVGKSVGVETCMADVFVENRID